MNQLSNKKVVILRTILICLFFIAWEYLVDQGKVDVRYTSKPTAIFIDLYEFIKSGQLFLHAKITLTEALLGLVYGSVAGIAFGILLGQYSFLEKLIKPIVNAIYGIPQLTLAPVYILWFGIGLKSKIFLAALLTFFQVFFATINAIKQIERRYIESAILLGANRRQITTKIIIPICNPWILTGIRSGIGSCLVGAIIGEYMGASAGFGWMIAYATSYFNITRVMTCVLVLLITGMVLNSVLDALEKIVLKWNPTYNQKNN